MRARLITEWPDEEEDGARSHAGSVRTWLVKGTRRFAVDPRRRLGRHGGARRLLAADGDAVQGPQGAWGGLVSALQRHTVHGELAQLPKEDRQILSLAYLGGHTNREIAAMLHVSVSTVRRRLSLALARLEESMRRAGVWVTSLALLSLAVYNRIAHSARSTRWPSTVALVTAGTATAVTLGLVGVGPSSTSGEASRPVTARPSVTWPSIGAPTALTSTSPAVITMRLAHPKGVVDGTKHLASQVTVTASRVCHGNPTSAPPAVPVGPRTVDPPEPPVTHPGPGGCAAAAHKS